jgi:hypothetical protein
VDILIAERETRATRHDALWLLDHVEAETGSGDVVEFDVLNAVETALITNIPRLPPAKLFW